MTSGSSSPDTKFNGIISPQIRNLYPWGKLAVITMTRNQKEKNKSRGEIRVFVGYLSNTHRPNTLKMKPFCKYNIKLIIQKRSSYKFNKY